MSSLSPVCVPCGRVMLCSKTGRMVVELGDSTGQPYQIHSGDEYECPECQVRVVAGFGRAPVAESWDVERFSRYLANREQVKRNPYRRYVDAAHGTEPRPTDRDADEPESEVEVKARELLERLAAAGTIAKLDAARCLAPEQAASLMALKQAAIEAVREVNAEDAASDDDDEPEPDCPECGCVRDGHCLCQEEGNPRQKGDDDGVEYADPRDELDERRHGRD